MLTVHAMLILHHLLNQVRIECIVGRGILGLVTGKYTIQTAPLVYIHTNFLHV